MKHYLSFGGGINSAALYLLMEKLKINFEAIFVNHGADLHETYDYVDYFMATGRPITILKPEYFNKKENRIYNDLYDYCWHKKMVPSIMARWCTVEFKVNPVNRYIGKPCIMHMGIDAGEKKRARTNCDKDIQNRYLLIEHDIDRPGCKKIITDAGLKIPSKSGCYFCPFQKKFQWLELRRNHPDLFLKAMKLEARNMQARAEKGKTPLSLRNDGKTLDRLINPTPHLWPEMDYPPLTEL